MSAAAILEEQEIYAHAHPSTPVSSSESGTGGASNAAPSSPWDQEHRVHMIAGAVAGMGEHMAMFPVDVVKTRMQSLSAVAEPSISGHGSGSITISRQALHGRVSVLRAMADIYRKEGFRRLWRGVSAVAVGAAPSHALYFASFEVAKRSIEDAVSSDARAGQSSNMRGAMLSPLFHENPFLASGLAGAIGTVISDAVLTPADVVKQRMQLKDSPYASVADCFSSVLRKEGPLAFYASYRTTLVMNVPTFFVQFGAYEFLKKTLGARDAEDVVIVADSAIVVSHSSTGTPESVLSSSSPSAKNANSGNSNSIGSGMGNDDKGNDDKGVIGGNGNGSGDAISAAPELTLLEEAKTHLLAGGGAGAMAAAVTNPLDVCKTRLQCQGPTLPGQMHEMKYRGVFGTLGTIAREEGIRGLMQGVRPRVLFHTPAAAICWSLYELTKTLLS